MNQGVKLFAILVWLGGAVLVAVAFFSETLTTNWPIVFAILGVGGLMLGSMLYALEGIKHDVVTQGHYIREVLQQIRDGK